MTRVKACEECGETPRIKATPTGMMPVPMHTPSCTRGRCGSSHNPEVWPYTARCVKVGQVTHGDMHIDKHGKGWPGKFMTLDEELEFRDGGG